ncbi:MAG: glycosyltransferase [Candidatus Omnitrophica bacterium]|nr:glycosyltransferase [Candidatus Omnitrophota bacterium]
MILSVVIPCYNEEANITSTLHELMAEMKVMPGLEGYQIIVVDDHSADNTFGVIKAMNNAAVSCIRLKERRGSHIAIRAGLREARGSAVLFLPADGQEDPGILAAMVKKWQNGARVVWGLNKSGSHKRWHIRKSAELFYMLLKWSGATRDATVDVSRAAFFLLDRSVVDMVNKCSAPKAPLHGLVISSGPEQAGVEYQRRPRMSGKSKWSLFDLIGLAKDWIIEFSDMPLIAFLRKARRVLESKQRRPLFTIEQRT